MCNPKILHETERGCVVQCRDCNHLRVVFGTCAITQTTGEFFEFKKMVYESYEMNKYAPDIIPEQKCIEIPTPLRNMFFVFSLNELKQLIELISRASIILETENIISDKVKQN